MTTFPNVIDVILFRKLIMNPVNVTANIATIIEVLKQHNILLVSADSIIIDDMRQIVSADTLITAQVTDTMLSFTLEVPENETTLKNMQTIASKDGYKCTLTSIGLGKNVQVNFQKGDMGQANETNQMLKSILEQISSISVIGSAAATNAAEAEKAAAAAAKSAQQADALVVELKAELMKAAEATSLADVRHGSILAELQQKKNNGETSKEEKFFDTTMGKVTMWGGGVAAVGIVGYAAYTYFAGGSAE